MKKNWQPPLVIPLSGDNITSGKIYTGNEANIMTFTGKLTNLITPAGCNTYTLTGVKNAQNTSTATFALCS